MNNLLILPGGGNPDTPIYSRVYSVISREAKMRGYDQVFTHIRWPGHTTADKYEISPSLTLPAAVNATKDCIAALPPAPFVILARSFGCVVALKLIQQANPIDRCPSKIILWGPIPYWMIWETCVRDFDATRDKSKTKGLKIDHSYDATTEPVESLIQKIEIPTIIAAGEDDPYCKPAYLDYLRSIAKNNPHIEIKEKVRGAPHEVTDENGADVVRNYTQTLFD